MEPAPHDPFREARPFLAGRGRGEVAQPGEALDLLSHIARAAECAEVEVSQRDGLAADEQAAGKQSFSARTIAGHVVAGHGGEPQRLARTFQAGQ